jgi:hypothetical protein
MANVMAKSKRHTITVLAGTISLGKYTLVNKFTLPIIELLTSLNVFAKKSHGNVAEYTNNILGTPGGTSILKI